MQNSKEKTRSTRKNPGKIKARIIEHYKEHVLTHGSEPSSIYTFCKDLNIKEEDFYEHFNLFEQVAEAYWQSLLEQLWSKLSDDSNFAELSVREKMLTFYFEFFSMMRAHRSFFLITYDDAWPGIGSSSNAFNKLRKHFCRWSGGLVQEGISTQEISSRSKLSDAYDRLFWFQFLFLLNFWKRDRSKGFEKTDAAIEKSVNLSFDLIEKNAIDSALDFGKFMFQNR
jgi:hypothetical protein